MSATLHANVLTAESGRDCPVVAIALVALGSFSLLKFAWKTTCFLLQTFVIPGKSVCFPSYTRDLIHVD